uniref:Uncharacterized protein n=1 Tax=Arundo donax TaxID=35708 RepID=A0A0A8XZE1_ARUDO
MRLLELSKKPLDGEIWSLLATGEAIVEVTVLVQ